MKVAARIARRLAVRVIRGVVRRGRLIAVAAIAVAGIVAAVSFNLISIPQVSSLQDVSSDGGARYQGSGNEPSSVANYIRGQQVYDARLLWDAYSDRVLRDFQRRGW